MADTARLTTDETAEHLGRTRPARTPEELLYAIERALDTQGRRAPSRVTLVRHLEQLAIEGRAVKLNREVAVQCGVVNLDGVGPRTVWWISPENYASYTGKQAPGPDAPQCCGDTHVTTAADVERAPAALPVPPVVFQHAEAPTADVPMFPQPVSAFVLTAFHHVPDMDAMDVLTQIERDMAADLAAIAFRARARAAAIRRLGLDINTAGGETAAELVGLVHAAEIDLTAIAANLLSTTVQDITRAWPDLDTLTAQPEQAGDGEGKAPSGTPPTTSDASASTQR